MSNKVKNSISQADLDTSSTEDSQALGAQAVLSAQPGPWLAPTGGWVHVSTDGERMWVEVENK